jgi:hypothetical protein
MAFIKIAITEQIEDIRRRSLRLDGIASLYDCPADITRNAGAKRVIESGVNGVKTGLAPATAITHRKRLQVIGN